MAERRSPIGRALGTAMLVLLATGADALQEGVADTVHNLSVSGPGEVRAVSETEICKFCHIPHNALVPVPLWGHTLSSAQYEVPEIRDTKGRLRPGSQPGGSSRLCLSCHDGTVALGEVVTEARPIAMGGAQRLSAGRKGFLGTDLTGSHPISFVVPDGTATQAGGELDMGLLPLSAIRRDPDVRLDAQGKMQCTTCHDPHSDQYHQPGSVPRFWVKPTYEEVCLTCHVLR